MIKHGKLRVAITVSKDEWKKLELLRKLMSAEKGLELTKSELPFVFKGGTSLSKAYALIDRFSEDIDLSMSRKITESEKKNTKK